MLFRSLTVPSQEAESLVARARAGGFNLHLSPRGLGISLDEGSSPKELSQLLAALAPDAALAAQAQEACAAALEATGLAQGASEEAFLERAWANLPRRRGPWLRQRVFHQYRSESELLRYIQRLASRDLSLVHGMIP